MTTRTNPSPVDLGVEVGDFFVSSWGYDQTNIDFYKVVALTPKGIKVQHWTKTIVAGRGAPQESVVPGNGPVKGAWVRTESGTEYDPEVEAPIEQKRLRKFGSTVSFYVNTYSNAYLWDGKPERQTGSGWGH